MRIWLKEIRLQKGITQEKVSKGAGIERSYYTMIEQGRRTPSVQVAKKIAKYLEFDWTIFFSDECNEMKHRQQIQEVI
ncbi:helix-turn-helix transcriptional regulator [Salipaludibacillus agaradhaerens]|uniref:helix-turn-helix transcriptional regulator n=1 Tax=Salipaludibacillus TaxID=1884449 RepID=UPI0020D029B3|nr:MULTISPECIES: helix-turn-helix transcriptional regulator [Salipaludibacillus]MCR6116611.1 helix-turn-helix transcriptional regulator [Salipaludibacillus agaradhaerens]UTR13451.1 helix-turn-helix transcriptional regulator [Salipaludibacillus sp. LMS25]